MDDPLFRVLKALFESAVKPVNEPCCSDKIKNIANGKRDTAQCGSF